MVSEFDRLISAKYLLMAKPAREFSIRILLDKMELDLPTLVSQPPFWECSCTEVLCTPSKSTFASKQLAKFGKIFFTNKSQDGFG